MKIRLRTSAYKDSVKNCVVREEQPKRDDHHKTAATISNTEIRMINKKDNYFLKCRIGKWETTFYFNKKLPVEDVNL
jgi:hypothetical protein